MFSSLQGKNGTFISASTLSPNTIQNITRPVRDSSLLNSSSRCGCVLFQWNSHLIIIRACDSDNSDIGSPRLCGQFRMADGLVPATHSNGLCLLKLTFVLDSHPDFCLIRKESMQAEAPLSQSTAKGRRDKHKKGQKSVPGKAFAKRICAPICLESRSFLD